MPTRITLATARTGPDASQRAEAASQGSISSARERHEPARVVGMNVTKTSAL
jgi:hypothetical protein